MMKRTVMSFAVAFAVALCFLLTPANAASQFKDVKETDWFYEAVDEVAKAGIVNGTGNGMFSPNEQVTKLQFITMLIRTVCATEEEAQYIIETFKEAGITEEKVDIDVLVKFIDMEYNESYSDYLKEYYPDASDDNWWTKYVYCADHLGLLEELNCDGSDPLMCKNLYNGKDAPCDREYMGCGAYWFLSSIEIYDDFNIDKAAQKIAFNDDYAEFIPDLKGLRSYSYNSYAVAYTVVAGVINGVDENRTFNPAGYMTRGQACQVIYKLLNKDKRTPISLDTVDQYVVDRSMEKVPENIRGMFDKTLKEQNINANLWFGQLPDVVEKDPLDGLNYYYEYDEFDSVFGSFDSGKITYYTPYDKMTVTRDYKILNDHLLAVAGYEATMNGDVEVVYFIYSICGDKLYCQRLSNPTRDDTSVNSAVYAYNIITAEQAQEMKTGRFSLSDAIGSWTQTPYTKTQYNSVDITEDTSHITIYGKTYACKALGDDRFELSANGKKAVYTIWTPKHDEIYLKILYLRYDSDSEAPDVLGIFSEDDMAYPSENDHYYYIELYYEYH